MARFAGWVAIATTATFLAACADDVARAPISTIIDVSAVTSEYGAASQARGAHFGPLDSQLIELRVDDPSKAADDPAREIEGATCRVRGPDFSATVLSPIGVKVPVYRHRTPPIAIACDKHGYAPAAKLVPVENALRDAPNDGEASARRAAAGLAAEIGDLFASDDAGAPRDLYEYRSFAIDLLPLDSDASAADSAPSDALERSYRLPGVPPLLTEEPRALP